LGSSVTLIDNGSVTVDIGFTFSFFNKQYTKATIDSNGYITFGNQSAVNFQGTFSTGESIWLWWTPLIGSTGMYRYNTQGIIGSRIFIVDYVASALSVQLAPNGPDLCSSNLFGQIRLYEKDYSIEIDILTAPLLQDTMSISGIHSDEADVTILTIRPVTFNYANGSWAGPYLGISPDPVWSRTLCPFPIASRFVCQECSSNVSCVLPQSSSGTSRCNSSQTLSCRNGFCVQSDEYIEEIDKTLILSSMEPKKIKYTSENFCLNTGGCCVYGPSTYIPPSYLTDICPFTKDCFDAINTALCGFCNLTAIIESKDNNTYLYISEDEKDKINELCKVTDPNTLEGCNSSIFKWPDFPLKHNATCKKNVFINDRSGIITDGNSAGYYANNLKCEWQFNIQFCSSITLEILAFETEEVVDNLTITTWDEFQVVLHGNTDETSIELSTCNFNIVFRTNSDIVGTGFTIQYFTDPFPLEYPILIKDFNKKVLSIDEDGELQMLPFTGDYSQFWQIFKRRRAYLIKSFFNDEISLSVEDHILILDDEGGIPWNITDNTDSWIISTYPYTLNSLSLGLDFDISEIDQDHMWYFEDGVSYEMLYCEPVSIIAQEGTSGIISDGSGDLLYIGGDYDCPIQLLIPHGSLVRITLTAMDIADLDFLGIEIGDEQELSYTGLLEDLNSEFVYGKDIGDDSITFWFRIDGSGLTQGYTVSYYVYPCEVACTLNDTGELSDLWNQVCNEWAQVQGEWCLNNVTMLMTNESGLITDGSGDSDEYANYADCGWRIVPPDAEAFMFFFCEFNTELFYDFVTIKDTTSTYKTFDGEADADHIPRTMLFLSNEVLIGFTSDHDITSSGFHIYYISLKPGCGCDHLCLQDTGSCYCRKGYTLDSDGITCNDVDECLLNNTVCGGSLDCVNKPGTYECICKPGYMPVHYNQDYCIEIDECALGISNCSDFCKNTDGSYECSCKANRHLNEDGLTCTDYPQPSALTYTLVSYSFCNISENLSFSPTVLQLGCDAISQTTKEIQKCLFPFTSEDIIYNKCTSQKPREKEWCAISVDEDFEVIEKGDCTCSNKRSNIILNIPAFSSFISEPNRLNDGIIEDNMDSACIFSNNNWYTIFSDTYLIKEIRIYNCPSCYNLRDLLSLKFQFLSDLTDTVSSVIWEDEFFISSNKTNWNFYFPTDNLVRAGTVIISTTSSSNIYLTEIEIIADVHDANNPSPLDCGLLLSRYPFEGDNFDNSSSAFVWSDVKLNINDSFSTNFNFKIIPDSTDVFSFVIAKNKEEEISIRLSFKPAEEAVYLESINNGELNPPYLSKKDALVLDTGDNLYCSIVYEELTLKVKLDENLIITYDLNFEQTFGSSTALFGFIANSDIESIKRALDNPGSFILSSWDTFIKDPVITAASEVDNTATIIGSTVGVCLAVIILILIIFLLLRRDKNSAVNNLPSDIRRHYKQYSHNPRSWMLHGDVSASHTYLKKLRLGTDEYNKLMSLWLEMGGSRVNIAEAYAIHNMLLLNAFAIKHTSITSQVTGDRKVFQRDNWKQKRDPAGLRAWTSQIYEEWVGKFHWNQDLLVKIIPAVHGTNEPEAYKIVTTGFVALAQLDSGYYGKGIYFTTSVQYALPYFISKEFPTVIVCLVISGNAYPVIEHPYNSKNTLIGAALMPGYQSHYVITRKNGFPSTKILTGAPGEEFYDEIVIEQEASILPFYLLKISKTNFKALAERMKKEEDQLADENLPPQPSEVLKQKSQRVDKKSPRDKQKEDAAHNKSTKGKIIESESEKKPNMKEDKQYTEIPLEIISANKINESSDSEEKSNVLESDNNEESVVVD